MTEKRYDELEARPQYLQPSTAISLQLDGYPSRSSVVIPHSLYVYAARVRTDEADLNDPYQCARNFTISKPQAPPTHETVHEEPKANLVRSTVLTTTQPCSCAALPNAPCCSD